ncbi:MAG TPA: NADH-quinone oxidoreductase subunit NuoH [Gemmatimonadota bacterium]|nr:NADH-quinone oxidoreductase subunit NuoH [Gemmatimonadota bacterium]
MTPIAGTAFVVATAIKVVGLFTLLLVFTALCTYLERKVAGFIQDRSGPNRVGPLGLLQVLADGLKFILKEEVAPQGANRVFFYLAPAIALVPATILFAVIPFAAPLPTEWGLVELIVADVPIGFLYVLAIASLGVYGIVMAGWASNSKYSFLGGLRGSAQMISYEIALAMSLVPLLLLAGNVSMPEIVSMQQGFGETMETWGVWFVLPLLAAFFLFFVSSLAETNRLPFDLPEAEGELVGGYHTEYSSMKFGLFFLGEYAHLVTTACLVAVFFLGGWDIPFWSGDNIAVLADGTVVGDPTWWKTLLTALAFGIKTFAVVLVFMWIRWTLPRFRYDQLMNLGWKVFLPLLMVYIMGMAVLIYALDAAEVATGPTYALILAGANLLAVIVLVLFVDRGLTVRGAAYRQVAVAPGTEES